MRRKFGDFLRSSTTRYKHLYQAELQNLGISTYLYTEMLIRPVYAWLAGCLPGWKEGTLALSCDPAVHKHYKSHSSFSVYMSRVIRNDSIWWRGAYLLLVPQGRRLLETGPLLRPEHSFLFWETAACETTLWCL